MLKIVSNKLNKYNESAYEVRSFKEKVDNLVRRIKNADLESLINYCYQIFQYTYDLETKKQIAQPLTLGNDDTGYKTEILSPMFEDLIIDFIKNYYLPEKIKEAKEKEGKDNNFKKIDNFIEAAKRKGKEKEVLSYITYAILNRINGVVRTQNKENNIEVNREFDLKEKLKEMIKKWFNDEYLKTRNDATYQFKKSKDALEERPNELYPEDYYTEDHGYLYFKKPELDNIVSEFLKSNNIDTKRELDDKEIEELKKAQKKRIEKRKEKTKEEEEAEKKQKLIKRAEDSLEKKQAKDYLYGLLEKGYPTKLKKIFEEILKDFLEKIKKQQKKLTDKQVQSFSKKDINSIVKTLIDYGYGKELFMYKMLLKRDKSLNTIIDKLEIEDVYKKLLEKEEEYLEEIKQTIQPENLGVKIKKAKKEVNNMKQYGRYNRLYEFDENDLKLSAANDNEEELFDAVNDDEVFDDERDRVNVVRTLLEEGTDPNNRDEEGKTPLMLAVVSGFVNIAKLLLSYGADVNAQDNDGTTALMIAAVTGSEKLTKLLLEAGANIHIKNKFNNTAYMYAATHKYFNLFELMMNYDKGNKKINKKLIKAVNRNEMEEVRRLLEAGADVNAKDHEDHTALILAAFHRQIELVKMLLEAGADVNAKSIGGYTALDEAAGFGYTKIAKLLLEYGAEVDAKDEDGFTALITAARFGHTETVELLLEAGADVNAKNSLGWTALIAAAKFGYIETVELLLKAGAEVDPNDTETMKFIVDHNLDYLVK